MKQLKHSTCCIILCICLAASATAQAVPKKYPGLLWEISGNGLAKPSYLFGTMHVSSKLAFHLSDSFYYALKQVDAVALELNPDLWQPQMVRLARLNENYAAYVQTPARDFIKENSFRLSPYEEQLKTALSTEPPVVNSLLYRSYKTRDDFEEDTFLDLYIFQAGRKLGKRAAGVEDYYESEKLVMEAYRDAALEKNKKPLDLDGETIQGLLQKLQQAYRYGDLDMMDSLDNIIEQSKLFREKFLYKRNEIQAHAIDSIIRSSSLFAGVGAAHLPGDRGVIELLRKKGYTLRPVKITDRDADQKATIDKLKVPVSFSRQSAEDGMYSVEVPGPLYELEANNESLNRSQFADMNNGAYYMVTRVRTYTAFFENNPAVLQKVDSLLYEYVPGTILSKEKISRNGYPGYDIGNRTRRGDMQRYNIFVTPFEILLFKMSGKNDYVAGEEANRFFGSIRLKEFAAAASSFSPKHGEFSVFFPQEPFAFFNARENDRWEYEAFHKNTGDACLMLKRSVYNYDFLSSDSFDLAMIEQSFRSSAQFAKQAERKYGKLDGYPALFVKEKLQNGAFVQAAYVLRGPHYYVLAQRSKTAAAKASQFFQSVRWLPFLYEPPQLYEDSFLLLQAHTPVRPVLDNGIRSIIEKTLQDASNGNNPAGYVSYWKNRRNAVFQSKSTGEMVSIILQEFPAYYYIRDSAKWWQDRIDNLLGEKDMVLHSKKWISTKDTALGWQLLVRDTGSSRQVERLILRKGKYQFLVTALSDTMSGPSSFITGMLQSAGPSPKVAEEDMYASKLPLFFSDLFSADSASKARARQAIENVYYGRGGAAMLYDAIKRLSITENNYFSSKASLIAELGNIKDSMPAEVPGYLKEIYRHTADTSFFQNEALLALARLHHAAAAHTLREIIMQDPPVFENEPAGQAFFDDLADSAALATIFFPDLLQFMGLSDYKEPVLQMLVSLVDSARVKGQAYAPYLPAILVDAKVAWKKQQAREEKMMEQENKKAFADKVDQLDADDYTGDMLYTYTLNDYAVLLMPFYATHKDVPLFFTRLLQSRNDVVRRNAVVLMLRNNKAVADSTLLQLALNDKQRGALFSSLEEIGRLDKFPTSARTQLLLARSYLVMSNRQIKIDTIVFLNKRVVSIKEKSGLLYCFKYRENKSEDWKIGFSGLQPLDENVAGSAEDLVELTGKKLDEGSPVNDQLDNALRRYLFSKYASGQKFYDQDDRRSYQEMMDY